MGQTLEVVELEGIAGKLVGIPGMYGLSGEQFKRLTIAVELVANPSILFMGARPPQSIILYLKCYKPIYSSTKFCFLPLVREKQECVVVHVYESLHSID